MRELRFTTFWWRITITHMLSYFLAGLLAWNFFNIKETYETYMMATVSKPIDSPWIAAGTTFQLITGLLWSAVLWPFREVILTKNGWIPFWLLLIGLAILGTEQPAPGSIEGMIYLKIPIKEHLKSLPEVLLQTLIFSYFLHYWNKKPLKLFNIIAVVFLAFIILMTLAIFLAAVQHAK